MAAKKATTAQKAIEPKYQFDLRMRCIEAAATLTVPGPSYINGGNVDIVEKAGEFYEFVINGGTSAG